MPISDLHAGNKKTFNKQINKTIVKQKELLIYLCITVSILNIFAILFSAKSQKTEKVNIPSKVSIKHTPSSSDVYVPSSIELAGETTPTQRNEGKYP